MSTMRTLFRFPNPVDERAARTVAIGVLSLALVTVVTHQHLLLIPLAYGFAARVAAGPRLSPFGLLATRVVVPRLPGPARLTAGPPKRFAQALGLCFSASALVLALGFQQERAADVVLLALIGAAALEGLLGYCVGCRLFAVGMRLGIVPEQVCEACTNLNLRRTAV